MTGVFSEPDSHVDIKNEKFIFLRSWRRRRRYRDQILQRNFLKKIKNWEIFLCECILSVRPSVDKPKLETTLSVLDLREA